jgi:Ca2+-binding RTX toxin-like protein
VPGTGKVVFTSLANNLLGDNLDNNAKFDLFVANPGSPTSLHRASTAANGDEENLNSTKPVVSPDGLRVGTIVSSGTPSPGSLTVGGGLVRLKTLNGSIDANGNLVSPSVDPFPGVNGSISSISFSPDGREIALATNSNNLGPVDGNSVSDIYIKTIDTLSQSGLPPGSVRLVSTSNSDDSALADLTGADKFTDPFFSPDGTMIVFQSLGTSIIPGMNDTMLQIVARDLRTGELSLMSLGETGSGANGGSLRPKFSADGKSVIFDSAASDLVGPGLDGNMTSDVFAATLPPAPVADDILAGGHGNDVLIGGGGTDTAAFPGPRHRYVITPNGDGLGNTTVSDLLNGIPATPDPQGVDTLKGVELLDFGGTVVPVSNPGPGNAAPVVSAPVLNVAHGATIGPFVVAADPNGDPLTLSIGNTPAGTATLNAASRTLTYTAPASGTADVITVTASDPFGASASFDVTVALGSGSLAGGDGDDLLSGGDGAETLTGGGGNDVLSGGGGNDTLDGGVGTDTMTGGSGDDTFVVDQSADVVIEKSGEGTDTVRSSAPSYTLPPNVEHLVLVGAGGSGTGNTGPNTITGNAAANALSGLGGNDTLDGGAGDDTLAGGDGDDLLIGRAGKDKLDGGAGVDTASFAGSPAGVTVALGKPGKAGDAAGDTLVSIENLVGSSRADMLMGNSGANRIEGGRGRDTLAGGRGKDVFVYRSVADSTRKAPDRITDFSAKAGDVVDLSAIDAKPATKTRNEAFVWRGRLPFRKRPGEVRFDKGALLADTTGDGKADLRILLDGVKSLPKSAVRR